MRRTNEDFWLSCQYAKPARRAQLLALYAAHAEIQRIPAAVSEPPLGEIRLQWWREALDEVLIGGAVRAHPVVEALHSANAIDQRVRTGFETALEARARILYGDAFESAGDLEFWLRQAEAYLAPLALPANAAECEAVQDLAVAYHLARMAPVVAPAYADDARQMARALYDGSRARLRALPAESTPGVLYLSLTPGYLKRAPDKAWPMAKRLRLMMAMAIGRF